MVGVRGRGAVVLLGLCLVACGSPGSEQDFEDNVRAAADMAASIRASEQTRTSPSLSADESEGRTDEASPSPENEQPAAETTSSPEQPQDYAALWQEYPWGSNGLECPHPSNSPGISADPLDPRTVVIVGDSLVRDGRSEIANELSARGFAPVFVCWGGKNLTWGQEQVGTLRSLGLLPRCLVFNLGTNDLKGTTAQGLADAVSVETVGERLTGLLRSVADVDDVFVVDLAADLALAPSTMSRVGETPGVYAQSVSNTGVGAVVAWSSQVQANPSLIGSDGIHDSAVGRGTRATLIGDAVLRDCG
jgi:hypothetical protein